MCSRILTDHSESPPPQQDQRRTKVHIQVEVQGVIDVDEFNELMRIQALVMYSWKDPRLTLLNLKHDHELNLIDGLDLTKMWTPNLQLNNTEGREYLKVDNNSVVVAKRDGPSKLLPENYIDNSLSFDGAENPLRASMFIVKDFLCTFKLSFYPFDTQTCFIDLAIPYAIHSYIVIDNDSTVK